jgi:hypothetical protein
MKATDTETQLEKYYEGIAESEVFVEHIVDWWAPFNAETWTKWFQYYSTLKGGTTFQRACRCYNTMSADLSGGLYLRER